MQATAAPRLSGRWHVASISTGVEMSALSEYEDWARMVTDAQGVPPHTIALANAAIDSLKNCGNCGRDPQACDECDDCTWDNPQWVAPLAEDAA